MAETTTIRTLRGATLTLRDNSGTPKTYSAKFGDGSVAITNGGYEILRGRDVSGDYQGVPRQGQQAGPSTIAFSGCRMYGAGDDSTDVALVDLLSNAVAVSGWTTHGVTGEQLVLDVVLALPDETVAGVLRRGASYAWTDCMLAAGAQISLGQDGIMLDGTFESNNANPTITQNT